MKKTFVISNTPARLPFQSTALYSFLLWYFKVDDLYIGIFATIYFVYWCMCVFAMFTQEIVDLNATNDDKKKAIKSRFAERLNKIIQESERQ